MKEQLELRIKELEEVLKPFAEHVDDWINAGFSEDTSLVECEWPGGPENATFLRVKHLMDAKRVLDKKR